MRSEQVAAKKKTKRQSARQKKRGGEAQRRRAPALIQSGKPFLSLAMMVKDEEEFLEEALLSAKPWVDEMVVVDTGSTDRTVEIAQDLGAKVSFFEWPDDFSAARNVTIDRSSGEWVLILDADERIHGDDPNKLRSQLLRRETYPYLGYLLNVINIRLDGSEMNSLHSIRIFPNHENLRYRNRVHNQLMPLVEPAPQMEMVILDSAYITHLGYDPTIYLQRKKTERSLPLIEKVIEEQPDNLIYHFYKGRELCILKRHEEAEGVLEFVAQEHLSGKAGYVEETFKTLFLCYEKLGEKYPEKLKSYSEKMLTVSEGAIVLAEGQPDFWYYRALAHQRLGHLEEACGFYRETRERTVQFQLDNPGQGNPAMLSSLWQALQNWGEVAWQLERYEESYEAYLHCVKLKPAQTEGWPVLLNSVCALAIEFKDDKHISDLLERLIRHPEAPLDMFFFQVESAIREGSTEEASHWLRWGHQRSSRLRRAPKFIEFIEALGLEGLRPRRL